MKKSYLFIVLLFVCLFSCNNTVKKSINEEKYTEGQAKKAYKDLTWGMTLEDMINLDYISPEDTSKWVIPLKYKSIGHESFEDVSIMTHDNKLFAVVFHDYIEGYNNSISKLNEVKSLFKAKYGTPDFEKYIPKDSLIQDTNTPVFIWNIRYKRIKGDIEKSADNIYFVNVTIEDTITRHLHDSIAIAYQSKDL